MKVLVVGAGFSGAVIARELAEANIEVQVIDKRTHIGGNCFDYVDSLDQRIHKYGPHLLHGSEDSVAIRWLSKFTDWVPYEHRVKALLPDGRLTSLPVNISTLEDVFNVTLSSEKEAIDFLCKLQQPTEIQNSDDVFLSSVGEELSNIFFRPYTTKMWGTHPKNIEAAVGKRIPVRYNRDDRYFSDSFQSLPKNGYTHVFDEILNHPLISVVLGTSFNHDMLLHYDHAFLCLPIDQFFDFKYGRLPYRSIIFENRYQRVDNSAVCINFTDNYKYTRMTQWDLLPNSARALNQEHLVTYEIPCDPTDNNNELYYPVRNSGSLETYSNYLNLATKLKSTLTFCGRTGLFRYLDMVPAINTSLNQAQSFLDSI